MRGDASKRKSAVRWLRYKDILQKAIDKYAGGHTEEDRIDQGLDIFFEFLERVGGEDDDTIVSVAQYIYLRCGPGEKAYRIA